MGFDAGAALDEKLERLRAIGFDAGAAVGDTTYAGAGAYRAHEYATLCAHPEFGSHETHGLIGAYYFDSLGGPEGGWGFPLTNGVLLTDGVLDPYMTDLPQPIFETDELSLEPGTLFDEAYLGGLDEMAAALRGLVL